MARFQDEFYVSRSCNPNFKSSSFKILISFSTPLFQMQHYNKRPTKLPCDPSEQQVLDPSVFLTTPPTTPPTETSSNVFNMSPGMRGGDVSSPTRYSETSRSPGYLHEVTVSSDQVALTVSHSQSPPSSSSSPPPYIALHTTPS